MKSIKNSSEKLILSVGTNNMVQKNKVINRNSENIFKQYRELVECLIKQGNRGAIVSILPRFDIYGDEVNSRIIAMNLRLEKLCNNYGISFINLYNYFNNRPNYFSKDGLHLNHIGKQKFAGLLKKEIFALGF